MNKPIKAITHYFVKRPRHIFLVDSLGAMLTAFFLLVVRRSFSDYIGLPKTTLTYLAIIAVCFCLYSAACYIFVREKPAPFLRTISIANFIYCILTMCILMAYYAQLTTIGLIYFLMEIVIICGLAYIEISVARATRINRP